MKAKPYSEVVEKEEIRKIIGSYPQLEEFLSWKDHNWVDGAFESKNEQLIGLFYDNESRERRLEMIGSAFKSVEKNEEGSGEIRDKIFEDHSFHDAFAEVQMISKLRNQYEHDKIDVNPEFRRGEDEINPDILIEEDRNEIVVR